MNRYRRPSFVAWFVLGVVFFSIGWLANRAVFPAEPPPPTPIIVPAIDWPGKVEYGDLFYLDSPDTTEDPQDVAWSVWPIDHVYYVEADGKRLYVQAKPSGVVIVSLARMVGGKLVNTPWEITIGEGGPNPDPQPDPFPDPSPDPVEGKIHVLLIYESTPNQPGSLSREQEGIPTAAKIIEYLKEHCADEDGQPAYRFLDPDADVDGLPQDWQEVFARGLRTGKGKFPWLIVASDQGGSYEGPLPDDLEGTLEMLKRYGGE